MWLSAVKMTSNKTKPEETGKKKKQENGFNIIHIYSVYNECVSDILVVRL